MQPATEKKDGTFVGWMKVCVMALSIPVGIFQFCITLAGCWFTLHYAIQLRDGNLRITQDLTSAISCACFYVAFAPVDNILREHAMKWSAQWKKERLIQLLKGGAGHDQA